MRYRSIALGGGGMKGGSLVGALKALQEVQGSLDFPDGIYGSSIGAFFGALIAFRIEPAKLEEAYMKFVSRGAFLPAPWVQHGLTFFDRKGMFSMENLRTMMIDIFTDCGIDAVGKRICDVPQTLFIVTSNMTTRKATILTGEVPLLDAILCSACIPGVFEPQVLYGNVYLDAAVYTRGIHDIVPRETLVIQLMEYGDPITSKSSLGDILYACYVGQMGPYGKNVCCFKNLGVGILDDVTPEDKTRLVQEGYSQTLAFLTKRVSKEL